jgi:hypothetical protein
MRRILVVMLAVAAALVLVVQHWGPTEDGALHPVPPAEHSRLSDGASQVVLPDVPAAEARRVATRAEAEQVRDVPVHAVRVLDLDGRGVEGAKVACGDTDHVEWLGETADDGTLGKESLPGRLLVVTHDDYSAARVHFAPRELPLIVRLEPRYLVSMLLLDGETDSPVDFVEVAWKAEFDELHRDVDVSGGYGSWSPVENIGGFVSIGPLDASCRTTSIRAVGYYEADVLIGTARLREGRRLDVHLYPRKPIRVHVTDPDGVPIDSYELRTICVTDDGHEKRFLYLGFGAPITAPGGIGEIDTERLPLAGQVSLVITAPGYHESRRIVAKEPRVGPPSFDLSVVLVPIPGQSDGPGDGGG